MAKVLTHALLSLLFVVCTFAAVQSAAADRSKSETTDFYGILQVPSSFFRSPIPQDSFYFTQPGEVILTQGDTIIRATVRPDGNFVVKQLPYGTYLLQAEFYDFVFPTVLVEVQYKRTESGVRPVIHVSRNEYPVLPLRGSGLDETSPAIIPTAGMVNYFVPREKFNILSILKNPMVIMMLVGGVTMLMTKFIPEEELKKSRAQSKQVKKALLDPQAAIENAFSDVKSQAQIKSNSKKKQ